MRNVCLVRHQGSTWCGESLDGRQITGAVRECSCETCLTTLETHGLFATVRLRELRSAAQNPCTS